MRFVRLFIISIVVLFLVVMVLSLFIPSQVRISRAINLKADHDSIMIRVSDPARWRNWYPGLDSARPRHENGAVTGYEFGSHSTARLTLISKNSNEVTASFTGTRLNPVINGWKLIHGADSLTLQWYMDFHLRWYPWEKFASLLLEKSYGPKMEQGLATLKRQVEN